MNKEKIMNHDPENTVRRVLSEEISDYFPWISESSTPYIKALPVSSVAKYGSEKTGTDTEGFERLALAQFMHNNPDLTERIIAGDHFYASGIEKLISVHGADAVVTACQAMCKSIEGFYSMLNEPRQESQDIMMASELITTAIFLSGGSTKKGDARKIAVKVTGKIIEELKNARNGCDYSFKLDVRINAALEELRGE